MFKKKILVILIAILASISNCYAAAGINCATLASDSFCSSWVGQPFVVNVTGGGGFSSISKFNDYVNYAYNLNDNKYRSTALQTMRSVWSCPNWNGSGIRYLGSTMCGIYAKAAAEGCSNKLLMCQDVCNEFLTTLKALFSDPKQCDQNVNRTSYVQAVVNLCTYTSQPCGAPITAEQSSCGFYTSDSKNQFCSNSSNASLSCCKDTSSSSLSAGAIAGIVIGVILGLALIALVVYLYKRRKNRHATETNSFVKNDSYNDKENYYNQNDQPEVYENQNDRARYNSSDYTITEKTREVWQNFDVRNSDEIALRIGDLIHVENVFTDDWAWGYNLTTKQEGAFPYPCVKELNSQDPYAANHHASINPTPRASSLYIPRE